MQSLKSIDLQEKQPADLTLRKFAVNRLRFIFADVFDKHGGSNCLDFYVSAMICFNDFESIFV